ncbi:Delta, partial [Apostichopus japonicus]
MIDDRVHSGCIPAVRVAGGLPTSLCGDRQESNLHKWICEKRNEQNDGTERLAAVSNFQISFDLDRCKDGFKGPQCAHKYCEERLCQNGGKCELDICDCPPNFAGDHCQFKNTDVCKDYCQNGGTCRVNVVDSVLVPNCTCTETFYGATCSKSCPCQPTQEGCTGDVCKSGGQADPNVDPNGGGAPVPILPIILVVAVFFIVILIIVFWSEEGE